MQRLYEAMFIVDSNKARENYDKIENEIKDLVAKQGGHVVGCAKWDDRRLAYEIDRVRRGTYILIHISAEGDFVGKLERQCQMSETVLRVLVTLDEDGIDTTTGSARERAEAATAGPRSGRDRGEGDDD